MPFFKLSFVYYFSIQIWSRKNTCNLSWSNNHVVDYL